MEILDGKYGEEKVPVLNLAYKSTVD